MAANTSLKRQVVKYIRDGVKSNYPERVECAICSTKEELELHHYSTVSILFREWLASTNYTINSPEDVMEIRGEFYEKYWDELTVDVVTLCNTHHVRLHSIYGANPALSTVEKQKNWVDLQNRKFNGEEVSSVSSNSKVGKLWHNVESDKLLKLWG